MEVTTSQEERRKQVWDYYGLSHCTSGNHHRDESSPCKVCWEMLCRKCVVHCRSCDSYLCPDHIVCAEWNSGTWTTYCVGCIQICQECNEPWGQRQVWPCRFCQVDICPTCRAKHDKLPGHRPCGHRKFISSHGMEICDKVAMEGCLYCFAHQPAYCEEMTCSNFVCTLSPTMCAKHYIECHQQQIIQDLLETWKFQQSQGQTLQRSSINQWGVYKETK